MDPNTLAVWKNLEARLDSPFRSNMVDLLLEMALDRSTDPHKIATWMLVTSTCICNAIFGIDDPMPLLCLYVRALDSLYPDTMMQITKFIANGGWRNCVYVIAKQDDLMGILWAAGSTFGNGELMLIGDHINVTQKGWQRFKSVWKIPIRMIPSDRMSV